MWVYCRQLVTTVGVSSLGLVMKDFPRLVSHSMRNRAKLKLGVPIHSAPQENLPPEHMDSDLVAGLWNRRIEAIPLDSWTPSGPHLSHLWHPKGTRSCSSSAR